MSDYKEQLDKIQEDIANKRLEKAKLEERLENLKKDMKQLKIELKEMGLNEITDEMLEALEADIKKEIMECQKSLN